MPARDLTQIIVALSAACGLAACTMAAADISRKIFWPDGCVRALAELVGAVLEIGRGEWDKYGDSSSKEGVLKSMA